MGCESKAFVEFDGREPMWYYNQQTKLRDLAKKDEVWADNLAKLKAACKDKNHIF